MRVGRAWTANDTHTLTLITTTRACVCSFLAVCSKRGQPFNVHCVTKIEPRRSFYDFYTVEQTHEEIVALLSKRQGPFMCNAVGSASDVHDSTTAHVGTTRKALRTFKHNSTDAHCVQLAPTMEITHVRLQCSCAFPCKTHVRRVLSRVFDPPPPPL